MQDKKAKKEMPLVGWTIASPEDCDKLHETHLILKVLLGVVQILRHQI